MAVTGGADRLVTDPQTPNWYRNHGFSVEADGWTAFLASMRDLKDQFQARMEREMEWQRYEERPTDVDCQEAIVIAVHLLQAGRRPGWPLPSGAIATWEAMSFLLWMRSGRNRRQRPLPSRAFATESRGRWNRVRACSALLELKTRGSHS